MNVLSRRTFLAGVTGIAAAAWPATRRAAARQPGARPRPTGAQLVWQRDELALFLHFGINTFTDREWGDGAESPALFDPRRLDARQWARTARAAGFRAMILTAKHHDGFCLWPTRTTSHSVAASPFRGGHGDVVREFVDACREEGLKAGLYLSPWDRHEPSYGDSPRYNDFYLDQLTELLTAYGSIHEVWFDGANGEGPNGRKQTYDWPRVWDAVRRLQPGAVIFSDAGPDVRWIGNERGVAGDPNWSTVDPAVVPVPGASGPGVSAMLQHGDPDGRVWRPGETDVSIRPGWFHHPAEDGRVTSADRLVDLYCSSVGRNSKLLLNVPPTREGLLHEEDVARLDELHARLSGMFAVDLAEGRHTTWRSAGARSAVADVIFTRPTEVALVDLAEDITSGQLVARHHVEGRVDGEWRPLATGTTIGCRRIHRLAPAVVSRLRLTIDEALEVPRRVRLRAFGPGSPRLLS